MGMFGVAGMVLFGIVVCLQSGNQMPLNVTNAEFRTTDARTHSIKIPESPRPRVTEESVPKERTKALEMLCETVLPVWDLRINARIKLSMESKFKFASALVTYAMEYFRMEGLSLFSSHRLSSTLVCSEENKPTIQILCVTMFTFVNNISSNVNSLHGKYTSKSDEAMCIDFVSKVN